MKRLMLGAALLIAACGASNDAAKTDEATGPQGLFEQAQAMSPTDSAVLAYTEFQEKIPTLGRPCPAVRDTIARGIIPESVPETSVYRPYVGSLVFALQCGEMRTDVRPVVADRWMVIMTPGAPDITVAPCLTAEMTDGCMEMVGATPSAAPKQD